MTSWPSWPSWVDQLTATAPGDLIHFLVCQLPGPGTVALPCVTAPHYSSLHQTGGSQHNIDWDEMMNPLYCSLHRQFSHVMVLVSCSTGQAAATCVVRWLLTGKLFIIAGVRSLAGHSHAVTRHALLSRVNSAAAERRLRTEAASRGSSACSTAALQHLVHTAASTHHLSMNHCTGALRYFAVTSPSGHIAVTDEVLLRVLSLGSVDIYWLLSCGIIWSMKEASERKRRDVWCAWSVYS